jgi:periplasmic protein TonB
MSAQAAQFKVGAWAGHARYRFGCSALVSAALHVFAGLLVMSVVVRTPMATPPIRVFLYDPPPPPPIGTASGQAPSRAEPVAQPKPAAKVVEHTHKRALRIRKRTVAPPAKPVAIAAVPPLGSPMGQAGGVPGGVPGGTVGATGHSPVLANATRLPVAIRKTLPEYPPVARMRGIEGQVILEAIVDADGHVEPDITVVQSVPALDKAAVAALREWRFRPARDATGAPMRVTLRVPVRFVLR